MRIQSDEEIAHFKVGENVRVIGTPQVMRVLECKLAIPHVHIEGIRTVHYKCEWRRPNGKIYSAWYEETKLEKASRI